MLRSVNSLKGFSIGATDGDIGEVVEFYFDDEHWTIRYLVVDTGGWLSGRRVLISPVSFGSVDWDGKRFNLGLTKEQVENSPSIDADKPVSRQYEISYYDFYNYPYYWAGPGLWGPAAFPHAIVTPGTTAPEAPEAAAVQQQAKSADTHLRSTKAVAGYYIEASDGDLGHVDDFFLDDENWTIRYLLIDTRNWWPGKKVLVSPRWVKDVIQTDSRVFVDLTQEQIKSSPEYDESKILDRDYESRLHRHYRRSEYWVD